MQNIMKSKTKISKQVKRKTNPNLVETILLAKKAKAWLKVTGILSGPRRKRKNINLKDLNKKVKDKGKYVFAGKVLSLGEVDKKFEITALEYSETAKEKLNKAGCKVLSMVAEIKKNPDAKGLEFLK